MIRSGTKTPLELSASKKKRAVVKGNIFKTDDKLIKEVEHGLNFKLILEKEVQKEVKKQKLQQQREQDKKMMKVQGMEGHKNILLPKYEYDDRLKIFREVNKPPTTIY